MGLTTMSLFFALLAVIAHTTAVGALALAGGAAIPGALGAATRRGLAALREEVAPHARPLAAGVAGVATAGSLYFSEIAGFTPCRLCWYQRGFMYPLVAVLALAHLRRGTPLGERLASGGIVLAGVGGTMSIWHILIERFPSLEGTAMCDPAAPCSLIWVERLGYVTIPVMALSAFALILTLLALDRRNL